MRIPILGGSRKASLLRPGKGAFRHCQSSGRGGKAVAHLGSILPCLRGQPFSTMLWAIFETDE